jgi:hypothetical protein
MMAWLSQSKAKICYRMSLCLDSGIQPNKGGELVHASEEGQKTTIFRIVPLLFRFILVCFILGLFVCLGG